MKTRKWLVTVVSVLAFLVLFYHREPGYNVAIYACVNLLLFIAYKRSFFEDRLRTFIMGTYVVASIAFSLYASPFAMLVVFVTYAALFGIHSAQAFRSTALLLPNAVPNYIKAWAGLFDDVFRVKRDRNRTGFSIITFLRVYWLPAVVVIIFMWLYSLGSKSFSAFFGDVIQKISAFISEVFGIVGADLLGLMVLGVIFGVIHALTEGKTFISEHDGRQVDDLDRNRKNGGPFGWNDLKYEFRSATALMVMLNILLTIFLVLEIKNEWIGWQWDGELLKSYVHTAVYALIFSIFLSIAVVAYFFRANLNFYPKRKLLLQLAYVWIALNVILVISVGIRNWHYIQHFALAYKRIGVFVFLLLCLVGLATLVLKLNKQKSNYFLVRWNSLLAYGIVLLITLFNWDGIIAKYNLSQADSAFVHGEFLMRLSDKALPDLQLTENELLNIQEQQSQAIPFVDSTYLQDIGYKEHIDSRIGKFIVKYEKKSWLERSLAESLAYKRLVSESVDNTQ